jgi:rhamnulokinase
MKESFLAFDLGGESGRGIVAEFDGSVINLNEAGRFATAVDPGSNACDKVARWDYTHISREMHQILEACEVGAEPRLSGMAINTWGVDFGLIDEDENLMEHPVWYRDASHAKAMSETLKEISGEELWNKSGIQLLPFNTIFQLIAINHRSPQTLAKAMRLLFMPDLLAKGMIDRPVRNSELTIASTSQLLNPRTKEWNYPLLSQFGLPSHIFQPIVEPGTRFGETKRGTPVFAATGHDTAGAVAAVPADQSTKWAYISSGTWSLVGVEREEPELSLKAFQLGLSNEIGIRGTTRLLKNIMGLWLVQECRRSFIRDGITHSYAELTAMAEASPSGGPLIDAAHHRFIAPENMPAEIRAACIESGYPAPETIGAIIRCALDSLALAYRRTLSNISELLDVQFDVLHIVGGGSKNAFLNQLTADTCGITVVAGPDEATAAGNILSQLVATGAVSDWVEARQVSRRSFQPVYFHPRPGSRKYWDEQEARFLERTSL